MKQENVSLWKCLLAGLAAGFVNGFFGAGGGMVLVPLLIWLVGLPDKLAFSSAISIILPLSARRRGRRRACGTLVSEGPGKMAPSRARRADLIGRSAIAHMLNFLIAVLAGLVCGVLSGFGIGGGSLLMVWMTAVLAMEQKAAQGINLLYFLPTAVCALIFHAKHRQICWKAVVPAALAGCAAAVPGALLAANLEMELLRKLFGGFLIAVGLVEIFCKGLKKKST